MIQQRIIVVVLGIVVLLELATCQVICGEGQKACGFQCYDKYSSKKCHPNGVLCDFMEDVCGYQCYTKSLAKKCHPPGVLCDFDEKPCGWRCYKPSHGETCNNPGITQFGPAPGMPYGPGVPYGPGAPYGQHMPTYPYPAAASDYGRTAPPYPSGQQQGVPGLPQRRRQ